MHCRDYGRRCPAERITRYVVSSGLVCGLCWVDRATQMSVGLTVSVISLPCLTDARSPTTCRLLTTITLHPSIAFCCCLLPLQNKTTADEDSDNHHQKGSAKRMPPPTELSLNYFIFSDIRQMTPPLWKSRWLLFGHSEKRQL